jgi:3',5'-cyclic AMP phosphodiesterase CpdA
MPNIPYTHHVTDAEIATSRESVRELSHVVGEALAQAGPDAMLIAWLSDFHCFAPRDYGDEDLGSYGEYRDPRAIARLAFEELKALHPVPDLLVYGGDMVNSGHLSEGPADEYAVLQAVLDAHAPAAMPSLLVLGNHDHGDVPLTPEYHRYFISWRRPDWSSSVDTDDFYYSVVRGGWRFITLDTRHMQPLSERQREWLAAQLRDESLPTIILQHRPYLKCDSPVDAYRFVDPATLALVAAASQVRAIVSGHTHKAVAYAYRDQAHIIFPALAYGIGDKQGWGCMILHPQHPPQVFIKELAVQFEDGGPQPGGAVRQLEITPYEQEP